MNDLQVFFENNNENVIHKWLHYFEIYDRHFKEYRNKPVVILEIGIFQGGSLRLWQNYFGDKLKIYAIDINPACKQFESENVKIFIGSQEDRDFLRQVKEQIPKVDIMIDDGGHSMNQQIVSFEELFDHIKDDGIYLCEDLHTSYWDNYQGGYKKPDSFIEYSKNFIDYIHAWHSSSKKLQVNDFTKSAHSLHYYDSILVVEKRRMEKPEVKMTGKVMISLDNFPSPVAKKGVAERIKNKFRKK